MDSKLAAIAPQVVVNAAAYHNVEACEADPRPAFAVNAIGSRNLAAASLRLGFRLIHISTDYVFDGRKKQPYTEEDCPRPLNCYGNSKLSGELFIQAIAKNYAIVRVSGLYGAAPCRAKKGLNFVKIMLKLARERGEVKVVTDEFVTPTYTLAAAEQIARLADAPESGLFHATPQGQCSWHEFAEAIFDTPEPPSNYCRRPPPISRPRPASQLLGAGQQAFARLRPGHHAGMARLFEKLPQANRRVEVCRLNRNDQASSRRLLGGLLVRRERWTLSWAGRLLVLLLFLGVVLAVIGGLYPFLAVASPVKSEILVVEGWLPRQGLAQTVALVNAGEYRRVFTSGTVAEDDWNARPGETYAELAAERLAMLGLAGDRVQPVPCAQVRKDRTYSSALAVKNWCASNHIRVDSLNLVTLGPHARRSRMLYQEAFGKDVNIGVITLKNTNYDPSRWWRSSEGFREVTSEAIAWFYAKFLFHPPKET